MALTAPNYPPEAFPDGVRINFHMNGVFNGCRKVDKAEIDEDVVLDCVHEMDTINHFVGMYPIAAGGVIEKAYSPFLLSLLGVMLVGFMIRNPKARVGVMAVGFGGIAVWMYMTMYGKDGIDYQSQGYVAAMVTSLDQTEFEKEAAEEENLHPIVAELRRAMRQNANEGTEKKAITVATEKSKADNIIAIKSSFENDQKRKPTAEQEAWNGSNLQVLRWHYEKSLGRWFNNPVEINPMVATTDLVAKALFWVVLGAMVFLLIAAWRTGSLLYWLLVVVPIMLPVFFIIEYSAWLWWYGHSLNEMGAFTLKPFMPTVFGQGKVAQFATHSYPNIGFGLMLAFSVLLALAALIRLKSLRAEKSGEA
ncbi:MAG: hypothetical protein R3D02_11105 [Hyphomicrobiales bacterium]